MKLILYTTCFTFLLLIEDSSCVKQTPASELEQTVHQCVHYSRKIAKLVTEQDVICLQCDPTKPACDPICQQYIDFQFAACHGVCLPDGFFFDYSKAHATAGRNDIAFCTLTYSPHRFTVVRLLGRYLL